MPKIVYSNDCKCLDKLVSKNSTVIWKGLVYDLMSLYSSCIIHPGTERWIDGQSDENFFPSPSWFVSTAMSLNLSFQSLSLVLSRFSLGIDLF